IGVIAKVAINVRPRVTLFPESIVRFPAWRFGERGRRGLCLLLGKLPEGAANCPANSIADFVFSRINANFIQAKRWRNMPRVPRLNEQRWQKRSWYLLIFRATRWSPRIM